MIRVPISEFLEIYLGAVVLWTFAVWLGAGWFKRRREARAHQDIVTCQTCGQIFRGLQESNILPCPNCGQANERTKESLL